MKVLTIRSVEEIDPQLKLDVHYAFGMERHTDHIFKDVDGSEYSSTINVESTTDIINTIKERSVNFPQISFIIEDLDLESNNLKRYRLNNGDMEKIPGK
jgi:hypothetical protein